MGEYSVDGSVACFPCGKGSFQALNGSASCVPCSRGYYSNESQSVQCSVCPPGSIQPEEGKEVCHSCPLGLYQVQHSTYLKVNKLRTDLGKLNASDVTNIIMRIIMVQRFVKNAQLILLLFTKEQSAKVFVNVTMVIS
jgi:hypothetical protein